MHRPAVRHAKIDGASADERRTKVVNLVSLACGADAEAGADGKLGPIGGRADHRTIRKPSTNRIVLAGVRRRPDVQSIAGQHRTTVSLRLGAPGEQNRKGDTDQSEASRKN